MIPDRDWGLFAELVIDELCGSMGRFRPGGDLAAMARQLGRPFFAQVPVPRSEPKSRNVHVAQVSTEPNFRASGVTWVPYERRWDDLRIGLPTAHVAT